MEWELDSFFKGSSYESYLSSLKKESLDFLTNYKDRLSSLTLEEFSKAIQRYEEIEEKIAHIQSYSYLKFAKDTTLGSELHKSELQTDEISQNILFFTIEFNTLNADKQEQIISYLPKYSYFLTLLKKRKKHQLSLKEESLLLKLEPLGKESFTRLFDESFSKFKFELSGKNYSLEELLSNFSSDDRKLRKDSSLALSKTLEQNSHLLTFIYNMVRSDLKIKSELRGYKEPEESMHLYNQIEKKSLDSLIKASESSFYLVGNYYERKRQILGYDELFDYDRYAPIAKEIEIPFDEAKRVVVDSFAKFSPKFKEIALKAFSENWIDAYPTKDKIGGAFSLTSTKQTHPHILLNYMNKSRDLFTLAHELGHGVHQYLSYDVGYLNSDTPLVMAETASIFCEMLIFDTLIKKVSKKEKVALLATKLEDIFATLYRQINFTTFERIVHAKDGELSSDEIGEIWLKESVKMFDGKVKLNPYYKSWWSYIPHFFHTPFYCYSYSYAKLLVLSLFKLYKSGKYSDFSDRYIEFLSLGGSKSPKELVAIFGLDIEDVSFWKNGILLIQELLDEFLTLSKEQL